VGLDRTGWGAVGRTLGNWVGEEVGVSVAVRASVCSGLFRRRRLSVVGVCVVSAVGVVVGDVVEVRVGV